MRTFKVVAIIVLIFSGLPILLTGQERIVELELNPEIRKLFKDGMPKNKSLLSPDTLELPFFDDFSKYTISSSLMI